jgi:hypothetical protein
MLASGLSFVGAPDIVPRTPSMGAAVNPAVLALSFNVNYWGKICCWIE